MISKKALLMLFVHLKHSIVSNVIDLDNLLVKTSKKSCVFDNQRVKLAKNDKISIPDYHQWN